MTTWMRCYWDEEDVWFYFEVGADGWVTRQVELQGPERTPIAAASLDGWQKARDAGRLDEYDGRFGITAELPVQEWEGHDPEQLTSGEFDEVWDSARRQIAARPTSTRAGTRRATSVRIDPDLAADAPGPRRRGRGPGIGSSPVRDHLRNSLTVALKTRDRVAVTALRSALAAIDNAEAVPVPADRPAGATGAGADGADITGAGTEAGTDTVGAGGAGTTGSEHIAGAAAGPGAAEVAPLHLTAADQRSIVADEIRERLAAARACEQLARTDPAERLRAEAEVLTRQLGSLPDAGD